MPKLIQDSSGNSDVFQWVTEPEVVAKYQRAEVAFLPITKVTLVDKGLMVFSQEEQVKGFVWKSKEPYKVMANGLPTVTRPYFMGVSTSKYLLVFEGDEGDIEGEYVPDGTDSYVFMKKAVSTTSRKLGK